MLTVTVADFANLSLLESPALGRLLRNAKVVRVDEIPPAVVTMYSRVLCIDLQTGERRILRLVYPTDKPFADADVTVLAAAGMALLGSQPGTQIQLEDEDGLVRRMKVEAVLYQPEDDLRTNFISA